MNNSSEQFKSNLKTEFVKNLSKNSDGAGQTIADLSKYTSSMTEEEENCGKCDNPKSKCVCKKKKGEHSEATGSGSSGAYSGPVFGGDDAFWKKSKSEMKETDITEACWKGYKRVGTKTQNGKKVPNCVSIGETIESTDKSAKKQFAKDLKMDTDYLEFKKNSKYYDDSHERTFGTPNVSMNDPYIDKRKYSKVGDPKKKNIKNESVSIKIIITERQKKIFDNYLTESKNKPTNPKLWSQCLSWARSKYEVCPSAYCNGAAAKRYKAKGGGWRKEK